MTLQRILPNALHFREFQNDPITGHRYHATCGETALATAMCCSTTQIESTQDAINLMMSMTREMMGLKWADSPDGATTTAHLHDYAIRKGFEVAAQYESWEDPIPGDKLHPWLLEFAGVMPIVLMITRAGAGLRAVDGSHPELGVEGHFICVVGLDTQGYICNDGDNNVITDHLVIYPWASIQAAHVTGFLMLEMEQSVSVPASWKDANGVITAPNGLTVIKGFADYIRKNAWEEDDFPLENEVPNVNVEPYGNPALGIGSRQIFRKSLLAWTSARGTYKAWLGQELQATYKEVDKLKAAPPAADPNPALEAQIKDLQAQLGQAQQQIADLKAKQVTPTQQLEINAVEAIRAAIAAH